MTATTAASSPCPVCGRPMSAGLLSGMCPVCLMAQGTASDDESAPTGAGRFTPWPVDEVARLFPQLEIMGLLGAGGMGAVYKARQPSLDRLVALKILPSGGGGIHGSERFEREAQALARLSHPNIVAVYEFGQTDGLRYFVMEFVDGANLRQLGRASRLAPREALQIVPQICDALQYAHDEGVVHRDIKPENVLVDRRGRVKIADFGLAKLTSSDRDSPRLTHEGQVMGTPHYMAPEQIERPLEVDHRADIYSLGVVLYEMLTGDLPLGKFPPPSRKVAVDVRLDEVVLRALENDPEQRFQRASEVKTRVESIDGGHRPPPARRWGKPAMLAAAALVIMGVAWAAVIARRAAPPPGEQPAAITRTADRDPLTGRLIATFSGGGRLELLAVSHANSSPSQWWRPDGTPELETTYEVTSPAENRELGKVSKDMIFRMEDLPVGTDGPFFDAFPAAGAGFGGTVARHGQRLAKHVQARFAWPPDIHRAQVRAGFAIEPWRVLATQPATGRGTGSRHPRPGDPGWRITFHPAAVTGDGELQASVILGPAEKGWSHRMVAVDTHGHRHSAPSGQGTPIDSVVLWRYTFSGLRLDEVISFDLEVRPIEWVGFDAVALVPSAPLPPSPEPRFSGPEPLQVTAFVDLDSGRLSPFSDDLPASRLFDEPDAHALWVAANGWDAANGPQGLHFFDVDVDELPESAWDSWSPRDVIEASPPAPPVASATVISTSGQRVLRFRTREGGAGLLRIDPASTNDQGIPVHLKRVLR